MQDAWEAAGAPPDGAYQATVDSVEYFESKEGRLFVKISLKIDLDPDHAGKTVESVFSLDDPDRIDWFKEFIAKLDLVFEDITELPGQMARVLDVPCEIALVTNENKSGQVFQNVYLNKRLGDPLHTPKPPAAKPNDDIPF